MHPRYVLTLIVPGLLLGVSAGAAELPFGPTVTIDANVMPAHTSDAGDIDGDGDLDLIVTAPATPTLLRWYTNNGGAPSTWPPVTLPTTGYNTGRGVRLADLDADGDLDVLLAAQFPDRVVWFENADGVGTTWTSHLVDAAFTSPRLIEAADFDQDGDLDLLAVGDGVARWWSNDDGAGTAWTAYPAGAALPTMRGLVVRDFNGDGLLDYAASSSSVNTVELRYGSAGGTFTLGATIPGLGGPNALRAGDIDGDGDLDIVAAGLTSHSMHVYENQGGGTWSGALVGGGLNQPVSCELVDLDRDGDLDIVGAAFSSSIAYWFDNDGTGTFTTRTLATGLWATAGLLARDLNGDGDIDVQGNSYNGGDVLYWENLGVHTSSGGWAATPILAGADQPTDTLPADLDGDGDVDVVTALNTTGPGSLKFALNTAGDGSTWAVTPAGGVGPHVGLAAADLDDDGLVEVVTFDAAPGAPALRAFELQGGAWVSTTLAAGWGTVNDVAIGDVDGDGDRDVVVAHPAGLDIVANPRGTGAWALTSTPFAHDIASVEVVDMDRDGDLDLLTGGGGDADWLRNDGGGLWTVVPVSVCCGGAVLGVTAADVDGDGDLDLLVSTDTGDTVLLTDTTGAATTFSGAMLAVGGGAPGDGWAAAADLDHDGDVDLVSSEAGLVRWMPNGAGAWTVLPVASTVDARGGALADIDGDGDLDILQSDRGGAARLAWYRNDRRHATLTPAAVPSPGTLGPGDEGVPLALTLRHDGRLGDPDLQLTQLSLGFTDAGVGLTAADLIAATTSVSVYLDDGDGAPGAGDTLVETLPTAGLAPTLGVVALPLAPHPALEVAPGASKLFFVGITASSSQTQPFSTLGVAAGGGTVQDTASAIDHAALVEGAAVGALTLNRGPSVATTGPYSAGEGTPVVVDASGSVDPDGVVASVEWDCDGDGVFEHATAVASCSWTAEGIHTLAARVTDDAGAAATGITTVTVSNLPPSITSTPPATAVEGSAWTYLPAAVDPGGDPITWSLSGAPAAATIDPATGALAWTPAYADVGAVSFDLVAHDGSAGATQTIAVQVAYLDADGDGMPDTWELAEGLDPTTDDAALDPDADGIPNVDEFALGLDPNGYDGPSAPVAASPVGGAEVQTSTPTLTWTAASDPTGDLTDVEVEVWADLGMTTLLTASPLLDAAGPAAWTVDVALAENADAYWRVRARDPWVWGPWTNLEGFFVNATEEAPTAPQPAAPLDGDVVAELRPPLSWTAGADADRDALVYDVELEQGGAVVAAALGVDGLSWRPEIDLAEDVPAAWRARSVDDGGLESAWSPWSGFGVDSTNAIPTDPAFVAPTDGEAVEDPDPVVIVTGSTDPDAAALTYSFEADVEASFSTGELATHSITTDAPTVTWTPSATAPPLADDRTWHLRVRAEDARGGASAWVTTSFFLRGENDPPAAPTLLGDSGPWTAGDAAGTFVVPHVLDPEGDPVLYEVVMARDAALTDVVAEAVLAPGDGPDGTADQTSWRPSLRLPEGTLRAAARAVDDRGAASAWSPALTLEVVAPEPDPANPGCGASVAAGRSQSAPALLLALLGLRLGRSKRGALDWHRRRDDQTVDDLARSDAPGGVLPPRRGADGRRRRGR